MESIKVITNPSSSIILDTRDILNMPARVGKYADIYARYDKMYLCNRQKLNEVNSNRIDKTYMLSFFSF